MPPHIIATAEEPLSSTAPASAPPSDSLFEHVAWVYAFCRERLFRDDTDRIVAALWPNCHPPRGTEVIELGCGPGFYAAKLAKRFPYISVSGADWSENQLKWARERAQADGLRNCSFVRVNVLNLPFPDAQFDVLLASRLFTVLPDCARAVAEMHRVLKSAGRCFIAEPRYAVWASMPLTAMWLLARMTHSGNGYREPRKATVFSPAAFKQLFSAQPWRRVETWHEGRYQYALCEKE
jgi:arsenite methyltransferase